MLTTPYPHQEDLERHMLSHRDSFNFSQQGTGKTWNALRLAEVLWVKDANLRPLVVCLKGNMKSVWQQEAIKHAGMDCSIADGTKTRRLKRLKEGVNQLRVINYHGLKVREIMEVLQDDRYSPGLVIYDESFMLQSPKRFTGNKDKYGNKKLSLSGAAHVLRETIGARTHAMTGTPHGNSPLSLWAQCYAVDLGRTFGSNFFAWRASNFIEDIIPGGWTEWVPNAGYRLEMARKLYKKPGLAKRFLKIDCLDLPDKVYQTVLVDLPKESMDTYRTMAKQFHVATDIGISETKSAGVKMLRLREICNGYLRGKELHQLENRKAPSKIIWRANTNPKQAALKQVLKDLCAEGGKVIVWHAFIPEQAEIIAVCSDLNLKGTILVGGMSTDDVMNACNKFNNNPEMQIMLGSLSFKGATHGANLQSAHASVYYSNTFSLPDREQSEDRNHRAGSHIHNSITYVDIVCDGTVEEDVSQALQRKSNSAGVVVDGIEYVLNLGGSF